MMYFLKDNAPNDHGLLSGHPGLGATTYPTPNQQIHGIDEQPKACERHHGPNE
jgi:hypothetical protein